MFIHLIKFQTFVFSGNMFDAVGLFLVGYDTFGNKPFIDVQADIK